MHWQDFAIAGGLFAIATGVFWLIGYPWYVAMLFAAVVSLIGWAFGRMGAPS